MASRIKNKDLIERVKEFATGDPSKGTLDALIRSALIMSDRAARTADTLYPLEWDIVPYSGIRTVPSASISAISQASPGVFTAASQDEDITGHGYRTNDIILIEGVVGMDELNNRQFVVTHIDSDTFSLKSLEGLSSIDTSGYDAYDSGGWIYHGGLILDTATILTDVDNKWDFKDILDPVKFGGRLSGFGSTYPPFHATVPQNPNATNITRDVVDREGLLSGNLASKPYRWRHWYNMTTADATSHYLFWYPVAGQEYNIQFNYQKEVPDLTFGDDDYPFHPPEVHEYLWHGALASMVGMHTVAKRKIDNRDYGQIEIMMAQSWVTQWAADKQAIVRLNRKLRGQRGSGKDLSA